jgi:hypothetical protein
MNHGQMYIRGIETPRSKFHDSGRFGRLFPTLPGFLPDSDKLREALLELGKAGGLMDAGSDNPDNSDIPAGFTFLGQFIDHDITFDPTSSLERQSDPEAIHNFRTPLLELDNVYGSGPSASPHLYDATTGNIKLLVDKDFPNDLPRNSQLTALIGDPRNDENVIVSQIQLAFIKFHNTVIDRLQKLGVERGRIFEEAQRIVRWHYQWIVLTEFLPKIVGQDVVNEVLKNGRKFYKWNNEPFIPVEFAVAAYRFGHSMIRPGYRANDVPPDGFRASIFNAELDPGLPDPDDLRGGKRAPRRLCSLGLFFDTGTAGKEVQLSKRIDTRLSSPLFQLPGFPRPTLPGNPASLAQRNLLRHVTFSVPSGQRVAKAMRIKPLDTKHFKDIDKLGLAHETPLWFYILREAAVEREGRRLGPVGGRIVAEVFIGLLEGDRMSYVRQDPDWKPDLGGKPGQFTMADLVKFCGATI